MVLLPCSTASFAVLHGSSSIWFQTSRYYRARVEFNSINLVRHGSSTTFETGQRNLYPQGKAYVDHFVNFEAPSFLGVLFRLRGFLHIIHTHQIPSMNFIVTYVVSGSVLQKGISVLDITESRTYPAQRTI